ncbi:uncharacterized protein TNCV_1066501 [Trichonephila clavipes]|uniref:Uncharacterized protein n=1 Tax=Trichonephila clavipes TaxID=2585209 RepID=A0A8X6R8U9_TRICX|nr:uncharacterized protein TNCV_1066501 [Trichonephila clavipes]
MREAHFWLNGYVSKQNCRIWSEVNGDRYRAMINFFIPELNNHDVQELWFQQDDATCHTARATIDLLIFQWLHRQLREIPSFDVIRHDAGRQKDARRISLEESILKFVAVRPKSNARAVPHHV